MSRSITRSPVAAHLALVIVLAVCASARAQGGGPDVRVNQDPPGTLQNETSLTLNPTMPGNIIVAYNDQPWVGGPGLGISFSLDNGLTWADRQLTYPTGMVDMFDPVVATDAYGNAFAACVATNGVAGGASGIFVYRSGDGGNTWWIWPSAPGFEPNRLCDKPHMAASNAAAWLCVTWIEDFATTGPFSDIYFNFSTSFGATWWTPRQISDPPSGVGRGNGPNVAVAPYGTVYVVWLDFDVTQGGQTPGTLFLDQSFDAGLTWGVDTPVMQRQILTVPNQLAGGAGPIARSYPCMAMSPTNSQELYVVFAEDPDGPWMGDEADVFFIRSTDGGTNWSVPLRLTPVSTGWQFEPWIAVKPDGTIDVAWYDGQVLDPGILWVVKIARSIDQGKNFGWPLILSDLAFVCPTTPWGQPWMGEYLGLAVDGTWAHVAFTSSVNDLLGDIYFDRFTNGSIPVSGDLNCDGRVDGQDIGPFVLLLLNPSAWQAQYPGCPMQNGDINFDAAITNGDVQPFAALLVS